eukprot:356791-Chlamydomonas_euryale.AAC.2
MACVHWPCLGRGTVHLELLSRLPADARQLRELISAVWVLRLAVVVPRTQRLDAELTAERWSHAVQPHHAVVRVAPHRDCLQPERRILFAPALERLVLVSRVQLRQGCGAILEWHQQPAAPVFGTCCRRLGCQKRPAAVRA